MLADHPKTALPTKLNLGTTAFPFSALLCDHGTLIKAVLQGQWKIGRMLLQSSEHYQCAHVFFFLLESLTCTLESLYS